jgi:hypothetical protein
LQLLELHQRGRILLNCRGALIQSMGFALLAAGRLPDAGFASCTEACVWI